ncbi:MAG: hypothetical protein Q9162_006927 [Coniocarpon cinnabarinum]
MTKFRPCIDLHAGKVKQIVGGTLTDLQSTLQTNYVSAHSPEHYARLYRENHLRGGHVILLGPNNEDAASSAIEAWPGGLQVGGGITDENAPTWIRRGAEKVIITSFLFPQGDLSQSRLDACLQALSNDKDKLVIDLSCRRKDNTWVVTTNKWQTLTSFEISQDNIALLERHCSEFLIHAADNEGLQRGIDEALVQRLAEYCTIPVTYAGGANSITDLQRVATLSNGKVDVTIGSALDIFGGSLVKFEECVQWNKAQS